MKRTYENVNVLFNEHFHDVFGVGVVVPGKRSEIISHHAVVHLVWLICHERFEELVQLLSYLVLS